MKKVAMYLGLGALSLLSINAIIYSIDWLIFGISNMGWTRIIGFFSLWVVMNLCIIGLGWLILDMLMTLHPDYDHESNWSFLKKKS